MKEVVQVDVGSQVFSMDKDASELLAGYLERLRLRIADAETMADIEGRIAEIFRERVPSPIMVVTIEVVREAIRRMGDPSEFEAQTFGGKPRRRSCLRRSRTDRMIAGVCGGLAAYLGVDATAVRLIMVVLLPFAFAAAVFYLVLWLVIPEADDAPTGDCYEECDTEKLNTMANEHKLYRSRSNSVVAGVCAGVAEYFGLDVSLVRLATLLLILFGGLSLWVYLLLWIIIPKERAGDVAK